MSRSRLSSAAVPAATAPVSPLRPRPRQGPESCPRLPLALLLALPLAAACGNGPSPGLALKQVTLYATGVGYFERSGALKPGTLAEIPLGPGQLDDALKSLVIVSDQGVASVEYDPPRSPEAARAEAGLPDPAEGRDLGALLTALRGVEVKVQRRGAGALIGRVLDVERIGEKEPKEVALLLHGPAGLTRIPLDALEGVTPLDPGVATAWDRAAAAEAVQAQRRTLRVRGGSGGGEVTVGYTTEAPVWRTTYRLLAGEGTARLQGFALVHNDSDEAWDGVEVSLVSGRPSSFLFPLAGPRYGRRDLVEAGDGLEAAPQLATTEVRELLQGTGAGALGLGLTGTGSGGGGVGYGYGSGRGSISTHGHGAGAGSSRSVGASAILSDGPSPVEPAAVSEAGDLFLYTVKEPVHLPPRHSALLPIIDGPVTAERVTIIGGSAGAQHAVRFENDTRLTLEGGVLSIFADGAFAGEAQLDRVKPKEVRVIAHGEDLDLEPTVRTRTEEGLARVVRRVNERIEVHRVDRRIHVLHVVSRSDRPRQLLVPLPSDQYRVVSGAEEDVRSPGQQRYARLSLLQRQELDVEIVEEGAVAERLGPELLTVARVDQWLASDRLDEQSRTRLAAVRSAAARAQDAEARRLAAQQRQAHAEADVARLRESVAAAGKGGVRTVADALGERLLRAEGTLERERSASEQADRSATAARQAALDELSKAG